MNVGNLSKEGSLSNGSLDGKTGGGVIRGGSGRATPMETGTGTPRQRLPWGLGAVSQGFIASAEVRAASVYAGVELSFGRRLVPA